MKSKSWLCASLSINIVLAGVLALVRHPKSASTITTLIPSRNHVTNLMSDASAASSIEAPPTNLLSCAAMLRDAGAPNQILAKIVLMDFDERWQQRLRGMQDKYARGEIDANPTDVLNATREEDQEKEMHVALGAEGFKEWDLAQTLQSFNLKNVSLTEEETNAIYSLHKGLQLQLRTLDAARLKGDIDQEEYGKACTAAQQGNDEKLKELFGIDRLATMQSSASQPDNVLEHALHKLNASNDQISSVLKLEQNYAVQRTDLERQMQNNSGNPASLQEKLQALDASRDLQYQTVLGADASGSLQKEKDYRYQAMKQHADAWDLNDSQIDYVYQDIQSYQKKVDDYQRRARAMEVSGETVDWDAVNQILIQFSLQNKQTLEDYLGVDQFNKLQKNYLLPFSQPQ